MQKHRFLGRVKNSKDDFYETPRYVSECLLKREKFKGSILEPCCGSGSISKIIKSNINFDIVNRGYGKKQDFFSYNKRVDNIVTNPPYKYINKFIEHALDITNNKICFLTRIQFLEGVRRYNNIFKNNPPKVIYLFSNRIDFNPIAKKEKRIFGGMFMMCWIVWDKLYKGKTYIEWINDEWDGRL